MNMIQAQDRYIARVNGCHTGHQRRVARAAWKQLFQWAENRGYEHDDCRVICEEARDMAVLERNSED